MFQQILDRNPKVSYRTVVSIVSISYKLAQHILTKNLGPFSFKRNKTGAINPYTIEKRVKSGKELTGSFKFVQDWKFCTYGGTFITFHKVYSQSTPLNSASVKLGSLVNQSPAREQDRKNVLIHSAQSSQKCPGRMWSD